MLLALLLVHCILGSLSLIVGRGMERPLALRYWGAGLLTYAVGILISLPSHAPYGFNRVVGAAIIGLAAILTTTGLLKNTDSRLNLRWVGAAYVVTILLLVGNHMQQEYSVVFDFVAPSPFPNALIIFAIYALLRSPPPDARTAARFLAGVLAFAVVVWTIRIGFLWASIGDTNDRSRADLTIAVSAIAQIGIAISATLGLLWVEVRKLGAELLWLAGTDSLTGLPNRRATLIKFEEEAARGVRHQRPYSIVIFDIDNFKKVNDEHGHTFGDEVLKQVARELSTGKREVDVVGRFGGEEFIVILSEEGVAGAGLAANRLHQRIQSVANPDASGKIPVTLSGGVATAPTTAPDGAISSLPPTGVFTRQNGADGTASCGGRRVKSEEPQAAPVVAATA